MTRPPWEDPEDRMTKRERKQKRHEETKYEAGYCDDCGEKRAPPRMDLCPYCHPNTEYAKGEFEP